MNHVLLVYRVLQRKKTGMWYGVVCVRQGGAGRREGGSGRERDWDFKDWFMKL